MSDTEQIPQSTIKRLCLRTARLKSEVGNRFTLTGPQLRHHEAVVSEERLRLQRSLSRELHAARVATQYTSRNSLVQLVKGGELVGRRPCPCCAVVRGGRRNLA